MRAFAERNDRALGLLALGFAAWWWTLRHQGWTSIDMNAVYFAALLVADGREGAVYAAPLGVVFDSLRSAWMGPLWQLDGGVGHVPPPYLYPPLWAWLLAPFAEYGNQAAFNEVARAVMSACLAASVFLSWRLFGRGLSLLPYSVLLLAALALTGPAPFSAFLNQPHAVVVLLILLAFERSRSGRPLAAGLALGCAAAVKITPIALVVVFLIAGDRRAAASAVLTAVALAGVSLILAGPEAHLAFAHLAGLAGGGAPTGGYNPSLHHVAGAFTEAARPVMGCEPTAPTAPGARAVVLGTLALALVVTWSVARTLPAERARALATFAIPLAITLALPIAWLHYHVLTVLTLPALFVALPTGRAAGLSAALLAILGVHDLGALAGVPRGTMLVLDLYLAAPLLAVALAAPVLALPRRPAPHPA